MPADNSHHLIQAAQRRSQRHRQPPQHRLARRPHPRRQKQHLDPRNHLTATQRPTVGPAHQRLLSAQPPLQILLAYLSSYDPGTLISRNWIGLPAGR